MQKNVASRMSALGSLLPQACALLLIAFHSTQSCCFLQQGIPYQFYRLAIETACHFPSQRARNTVLSVVQY